MKTKLYSRVGIISIFGAIIFTICAGDEAIEPTEEIAKIAEAHEDPVSFVLESASLDLTAWELHVLSDMTLGIVRMVCPNIQMSAIYSLKTYIRERVAAQAVQSDTQTQNRGLLPVYANLVQCYNRLTSPEKDSQKKLTTKTPMINPIVVSSGQDQKTTQTEKPKIEESETIHTHPTFRIWSVIKSAIHKFSSFLSRRKRSAEENSIPEKIESTSTTTIKIETAGSTLSAKQKILSTMVASLVDIASKTCLSKEPKQVRFFQQAMNQVLRLIWADELALPNNFAQISHLLRATKTCKIQA